MRYWYVDGQLQARTHDPESDAIELTEEMYIYCRDNLSVLKLEVKDGKLHISVDMAAYRNAALARTTNTNTVTHKNVVYYDDEHAFICADYVTRSGHVCTLTREQHFKLVNDRNRQFTLRRSAIRTAQTPDEVDKWLTT